MNINIEEIKKRAEELKTLFPLSKSKTWAADTILQLVAEVERINDKMWQQLKSCDSQIAEYRDDLLKARKRGDTEYLRATKLTNANKILRDKLIETKKQLETFKCNACSTNFQSNTIGEALFEADEATK